MAQTQCNGLQRGPLSGGGALGTGLQHLRSGTGSSSAAAGREQRCFDARDRRCWDARVECCYASEAARLREEHADDPSKPLPEILMGPACVQVFLVVAKKVNRLN